MYSEKPLLHARQANHKAGNLRTIALDVTSRCNMECEKCYAETFVKTAPVELNVLGRALDELYELGVYHYVLQGGEAIIEPERLEAILKMCHPDETYINVVTNGWEMTEETIIRLKNLKVDKIAFSLDSGIEQEHDALRRPGSFRKVIAAIDNVIKHGLFASISTVVTHDSLYSEGFKKAYAFAENKGIRIDIQIAEPVGKWDGLKDMLLKPDDTARIKSLQENCPVLANGQRMVNRDIFSGNRDHCPAGVEFMGLSSDGNFLPCNFLQFTLGNIRDRSVGEMRNDLLTSEWFDGKHPVCLCGEDLDFIDKFITPYIDSPKPMDAYKIFDLKRT